MTRGIWGCILSELKEYTPRPPKKNSGRDGVVTSSISLAAAQRAPAHSFRCSSFSHRKTLRWEPCNFPPRPSLKRPKEGGAGSGGCGEAPTSAKAAPRGDRRWSNAGFCPMTSLCGTGYNARRFAEDPARAHVGAVGLAGQFRAVSPGGLWPPGGVFSFDGSTAVFFLPLAKRKWGWNLCGGCPALPRLVNRTSRGRRSGTPPLTKGGAYSENSLRNASSSSASLSSRAWVPARDSIWWVSSWARVSRSSRRQSSSLQSSRSARAAKDP